MTTDDTARAEGIKTVRAFLQTYYLPEEWPDRGTIRALKAHRGDWRENWRIAEAFNCVLNVEHPAGTLQELVTTSTNQNIENDEEAREFLQTIYEDNAFDVAVNFDEFP